LILWIAGDANRVEDPFELIHGPGDSLMHHGSQTLISHHLEELEIEKHEESTSVCPSARLWGPVVGSREDTRHVLVGNEGQSTLQVSTVHPPLLQLCVCSITCVTGEGKKRERERERERKV
jgi:hypothetical protein